MDIRRLLAVAVLFACVGTAHAVTFGGTTSGGATWNRPLEGAPPTVLSGIGTAVPYTSTPFTVSVTGLYVFISQASVPLNWDNFTFLYQDSFDAGSPLANVLIGNDDFVSIGLSGFTYALTTGTSYFYVTTGFGNIDSGNYSNSIIGPGQVVIPGPIFVDGFEAATITAWCTTAP